MVVLYFERRYCLQGMDPQAQTTGPKQMSLQTRACHEAYPGNGCLGSSRNRVYRLLPNPSADFLHLSNPFQPRAFQSQFPCTWLAPVCFSFVNSPFFLGTNSIGHLQCLEFHSSVTQCSTYYSETGWYKGGTGLIGSCSSAGRKAEEFLRHTQPFHHTHHLVLYHSLP